MTRLSWRWAAGLALCLVLSGARAGAPAMGLLQLPQPDGGRTTVYYPTRAPENRIERGPFVLSLAEGGAPAAGNGRLVVISHGSGGSPWVHADLARALVEAGFTVALPQHHADNYLDRSDPGPNSFARRPREVSAAIDLVASYAPLAAGLALDRVGVFGGSAGGHTALSLAGGQWSPRRFRQHCEAHIADDFASCVGSLTRLKGNWLDGVKLWLAKRVIAARFTDDTPQQYVDARIGAAVAMVPYAADFDPASLRRPRTALGLVIAERDRNQIPRYHVDAVLRACTPACEVVMRMPDASHGAMLSPMPPLPPGSIDRLLLADAPGFRRERDIPELNARIADFFVRHLTGAPASAAQ